MAPVLLRLFRQLTRGAGPAASLSSAAGAAAGVALTAAAAAAAALPGSASEPLPAAAALYCSSSLCAWSRSCSASLRLMACSSR
jgi:hypothetical protein